MGCETARCLQCKINIGAIPAPFNMGQFWGSNSIQAYHLFIVYDDLDQTIVYRGGPASRNSYDDLVSKGLAQQYQAPTAEIFDIDFPFYNLVTNRMVGLGMDYDYKRWVQNGSQPRHMVTITEGTDYCGLDEELTRETRRIGMLGRTYNALDVDRTDNSNAAVYTVLEALGLPLVKPAVHAPGWGTNLHTETTVAEEVVKDMKQAFDPIRRELDWFDSLPSLDQLRVLRRAFGGR